MKFIMKFSEVFSSVVLVSLFFLFINLTTWMNIAALVYADQSHEIILFSFLLAINFIIVLYPSITAVTTISREWVINQTFKINPLLFFKIFIKNFKYCLIPGTVLAIIFMIFTIDLIYFRHFNTTLEYFFKLVLLLTAFLSFNSTIVLAHFEIKGLKVIIKALQLLLYPPMFLTLGGLTIIAAILFSSIGLFYTALFISFFFYLLFSSFYKQHIMAIEKLTKFRKGVIK